MEAHPEREREGEGAGEEGKSEERGSSGSGGVCIHPRELDGSVQGERVRQRRRERARQRLGRYRGEEDDTLRITPWQQFSIFSFRTNRVLAI